MKLTENLVIIANSLWTKCSIQRNKFERDMPPSAPDALSHR